MSMIKSPTDDKSQKNGHLASEYPTVPGCLTSCLVQVTAPPKQ